MARRILTAAAASDRVALVELSLPPLDPLALFDSTIEPPTFWDDGSGQIEVGLGAAWEATAVGASRFADLRRQVEDMASLVLADDAGPRPRFGVGLGFGDHRVGGQWEHFPAAVATLPARRLLSTPAGARWIAAIPGRQIGDVESVAARLAAELRWLQSCRRRSLGAVRVCGADRGEMAWRAACAQVGSAVARGEISKVVLSHRRQLRSGAPVAPGVLLAAAGSASPGAVRFAIQRGPSTLVGVTPELLVRRRGLLVETEALAGTCAAHAAPATLIGSDKDRREHQLVVGALRGALASRCESLEVLEPPRVRDFGTVRHLSTPISGRLRRETHLLDLAAALHPTPAVAGVPGPAAAALIAELDEPRGWYTGSVGWVDDTGDGELRVVLRSVLVRGCSVSVFAGAGLVAGSDSRLEWEEVGLKAAATLSRLGLEVVPDEDSPLATLGRLPAPRAVHQQPSVFPRLIDRGDRP